MIHKTNKEMRRSTNATPTRSSNKSQWKKAQEDPKQKQDSAKGRAIIHKKEQLVTDKDLKKTNE
jgi:hypothetical protein